MFKCLDVAKGTWDVRRHNILSLAFISAEYICMNVSLVSKQKIMRCFNVSEKALGVEWKMAAKKARAGRTPGR